jgi:hypothetical protein
VWRYRPLQAELFVDANGGYDLELRRVDAERYAI